VREDDDARDHEQERVISPRMAAGLLATCSFSQ
jgi:hypothetical protein